MSYGQYEILDFFGKGGFGKVILAEKSGENPKRLYVIKTLLKERLDDISKKQFNDEIDLLNELKLDKNNKYTPIIYGYKKYDISQQKPNENNINEIKKEIPEDGYYAMDYFSKGLLFDYYKFGTLTERLIKIIFKRIVKSLQYIHSKNISHLDIKLENIVFDKDFLPIFIDFGFATKEKPPKIKGYSLQYAPPEFHDNANEIRNGEKLEILNGFKIDIFALGVILFKLINKKELCFESSEKGDEKYDLIRVKNYEEYWQKFTSNFSDSFKKFYMKFVAFELKDRFENFDQILNDPWFEEKSDIKNNDEDINKEMEGIFEKIEKKDLCYLIAKREIEEEQFITKSGDGTESDDSFNNSDLKPKKISKNKLIINRSIRLNGCLEDDGRKFMKYLKVLIQNDLKGFCEASKTDLQFEATFQEKEEKGESSMIIKLFEYESDSKDSQKYYLIEFVRNGGVIEDYYYYFSQIKEIIINKLV